MNKNHLHPDGRPFTQEEFINKIKTDDEFARKWGELGPIYGKQWRAWGEGGWSSWTDVNDNVMHKHKTVYIEVDQISILIHDLKTNPDSRRLMVNAWNVGEIDQMVLPPCHYGFQVYTRELSYEERRKLFEEKTNRDSTYILSVRETLDKFQIPTRAISLMWNQRSVDTFLGLPFNIASYGLLLEIIAKEVNMVPDELIGNLGDTHLYLNHIEQAKEQIGRYFTHEERLEELKKAMGEETFNDVVSKLKPLGGSLSKYFGFFGVRPNLHTREPYPLPKLLFKDHLDQFDSIIDILRPIDFVLDNYQSHPTIKAPLSN